ncbi:MAG: cytidylate kinase-like family protein [Verrucomicrobia bacterium]|nr:cytidylate kinase-like family protein [Verrucomicrobiota bacterium]MBV8485436.1 cytidylate kinase-like family protein [Verrucomicrobiota bacterium]
MSRNSADVFARYVGAQFSLPEKPEIRQRPAIAISRQTGAGALTVANLIAQQLNVDFQGDPPHPWKVFDRNLAQRILEDHQLSARMEPYIPEDAKHPLTDALESVLGLHPSFWILRQHTVETIRRLAARGNVILVGRGASSITAQLPHVLQVRLVAPLPDRVLNFAHYHQLPRENAARLVPETDERRRRYVRTYFDTDIEDPTNYDLTINTGRSGFEQAARTIINVLFAKLATVHQQTPQSP